MASLTGNTVSSTYVGLLKTSDNADVSGSLKTVAGGTGTSSALQISTAGVKSTGTLAADGATTLGSTLGVTGAATLSSTLAVTGAVTPTAGLVGTTTNDDAAAGRWGEYKETVVLAASGVSITSTTVADVCSVSLTAGDWDVSGCVYLVAAGATRIDGGGTPAYAAMHTTSATLPGMDSMRQGMIQPLAGNGYDYQVLTPTSRFSLSATTTVYLVTQCTHNGSPGDVTASGVIRARRIR